MMRRLRVLDFLSEPVDALIDALPKCPQQCSQCLMTLPIGWGNMGEDDVLKFSVEATVFPAIHLVANFFEESLPM